MRTISARSSAPDQIRAEIGEGEHDQRCSPQAFALARERAVAALRNEEPVTINATASTTEERADWIRLAVAEGAHPVAHVVRCSLDTALRRNAERDRHVPEDVLTTYWHRIARITHQQLYREGFVLVSDETTEDQPLEDVIW